MKISIWSHKKVIHILTFVLLIINIIMIYKIPSIIQLIVDDTKTVEIMVDISTIGIGLSSLIISVFAIFFTVISIKQQKEQWLKNEYMKREASILLDFRDILMDTEESFRWFLYELIQPKIFKHIVPTQEQLIISIDTYCYHFNKINTINKLYNQNQFIFMKYGFDHTMIYFQALLATISWLDNKDMIATLYKSNSDGDEYRLMQYNHITEAFARHIHLEKHKNQHQNTDTLTTIMTQKIDRQQLQKYIEESQQKIIEAIFQIDELTTYYEGKIPNKLKNRQFIYYSDAEKILSTRLSG